MNKPKKPKKERTFKQYVTAKLKRAGIYYFVKEAQAIRGIPDIIGCTKNGTLFAWELKRSKWEVHYKTKEGIKLQGRTKLQWHEITKIRRAGGIADFVYPENFEEKFNDLFDH